MCSYAQNFVVSVIVDSKPIREINKNHKRTCIIPFGSEYKIRFKNYHNVRSKVEVFIDGTDVLFGEKLVLNPKETLDLERFLSDNNSGRKFKFVSLEEAEKAGELHDPQNYDNGHIQVKFYKELEYTIVSTSIPYSTHYYYNPSPFIRTTKSYPYSPNPNIYCTSTGNIPLTGTLSGGTSSSCISNTTISNSNLSETTTLVSGVTLEGNISDQKFYEVSDFVTENDPVTIDIWLEGKQHLKKVSPFEDFIFPAFDLNATDVQINRAKEWLEKYFPQQLDKNLHSVLQIFIIPILINKNSSLDDRIKAKNWLAAIR